ncbi:MAG: hypothetical protein HZB38_02860 [Planctomycetes bacterium]|nr:hypothetical protein [Planctomycetota bacterium]
MKLGRTRIVGLVLAVSLVAHAFGQLQGRVEEHSFFGPVLGNTVYFNIYLPEGYDAGTLRYPVIYFLHGLDGSQGGPSNIVVPQAFENARAAGVIGPVIIVFPNGYLNSLWADSYDGAKPAETDVVAQLIPHVDSHFRTLTSPTFRVMTGFSMGGFGAPKFYAKFPELFTAAVAFDGSLADWETLLRVRPDWAAELFNNDEAYFDQYSPYFWGATNAAELSPRVDLRLVVGANPPANRQYRDFLATYSVSVAYVETGCPHDMNCLLAAQGMNTAAFIAARLGARSNLCPADLNRDGVVDLTDLTTLLANFGRNDAPQPAEGNIDGNAAINLLDLAHLLSDFGQTCP